MDSGSRDTLRALLMSRSVAALGTLHDGAPWVSMVPFALLPDPGLIVVLVSGLASHTKHMREDGHVSLLVTESEDGGKSAQALSRVTVQGRATEVGDDEALQTGARAAYLAKFPHATVMLDLPDFTFFVIAPTALRLVGGFARAVSLEPGAVGEACRTT
ncbi:MAG: pyridoxamine 5'-phosphate oxidase family protein [Vicinamibacterales bacterium]